MIWDKRFNVLTIFEQYMYIYITKMNPVRSCTICKYFLNLVTVKEPLYIYIQEQYYIRIRKICIIVSETNNYKLGIHTTFTGVIIFVTISTQCSTQNRLQESSYVPWVQYNVSVPYSFVEYSGISRPIV